MGSKSGTLLLLKQGVPDLSWFSGATSWSTMAGIRFFFFPAASRIATIKQTLTKRVGRILMSLMSAY